MIVDTEGGMVSSFRPEKSTSKGQNLKALQAKFDGVVRDRATE